MKHKTEIALTFIITSLLALLVVTNKPKDPQKTVADIPAVYDTHSFYLNRNNLGINETFNDPFNATITHFSSSFNYAGTAILPYEYSQWFRINARSDYRFNQTTSAGSENNKWYLTRIKIHFSRVWGQFQSNLISIYSNGVTVGSFTYLEGTKAPTASALDGYKQHETLNFTYAQAIETFSIGSLDPLYMVLIELTYTINYAEC